MADDKQHEATTELNEALAAGFAARNFDGLGAFYTEDTRVMPPRGKALDGRDAVAAFWLGVSNRFGSLVFTTTDTKALGDAVRRETGTYAMSGADGQAVQGKYVFVWQLVDGEWQIESSIWNRNGDGAGGGRRQGQGQGQAQGQARRQGAGGGRGAGAGGAPGYRQGGQGGQGGYRQGGNGAGGGYRQGGAARPSFQQGGGGAGGRRPGGQGRGPGGGRQGGAGGGGGGSSYDGDAGLYANPKD